MIDVEKLLLRDGSFGRTTTGEIVGPLRWIHGTGMFDLSRPDKRVWYDNGEPDVAPTFVAILRETP